MCRWRASYQRKTMVIDELGSYQKTRQLGRKENQSLKCRSNESFHIASRCQPLHETFAPRCWAFSGVSTIAPASKFVSQPHIVSSRQPYFYSRARKRCLPSSVRFTTMVTQSNQNNSRIPTAIRDARTVIVGGGPTGLLAAIFMAQRNIPVTVVEQDDEDSRFDPSRTYSIWLNERGRRILEQVPELLENVAERGVSFKNRLIITCMPDGSFGSIQVGSPPSDGGVYILATRIGIVEGLRSYARKQEHIKLLKKTKVTSVVFDSQGEMEILLNSEGRESSIHSKLILACDGRNSLLGDSIRSSDQVNNGLFCSSNGLGEDSVPAQTSGRLVKSIALQENYNIREPEFQEDLTDFTVFRRFLPRKGRFDKIDTWVVVFDTPKLMRERLGGVMALVSFLPKTKVQYLKTVEEGYDLFDEVLPQMNARLCISPESMERFIGAKPLKFPNSSRVESLVVHVGTTPSAGVAFLGDAAHSFPPDSGQGVNAAFEDVVVLMQVFDRMGANASIEDTLREYEAQREEDVKALTTIIRRLPAFSRSSPPALALRILDRRLRGLLAKQFPGVFHPGMFDAMASNYRYRDALRFHDLTTARLLALGASIPLIPILGNVALRMMKLGLPVVQG